MDSEGVGARIGEDQDHGDLALRDGDVAMAVLMSSLKAGVLNQPSERRLGQG